MSLRNDQPQFEIVNDYVDVTKLPASADGRVKHCDRCGHRHVPGTEHPDVNLLCDQRCCNK